MALFEIVFQGQVRDGIAPEQARARIGQLFQAGERQLEVLFSGRRVVIKQGLDATAAEKYRQAIERAGAVCLVEPMAEQLAAAPQAARPVTPAAAVEAVSSPSQAPAKPTPARLVPRDEFMAAFSEVDAPDYGIAPVGSDLQDEYQDFTPLPLDLSALSLAPVGSDMNQLQRVEAAIVPDTSHLKLES